MILFDFAYVAESAKFGKCTISQIDDVDMCKNSLFLTLTGLEGLLMHFDTKFNSLL